MEMKKMVSVVVVVVISYNSTHTIHTFEDRIFRVFSFTYDVRVRIYSSHLCMCVCEPNNIQVDAIAYRIEIEKA